MAEHCYNFTIINNFSNKIYINKIYIRKYFKKKKNNLKEMKFKIN